MKKKTHSHTCEYIHIFVFHHDGGRVRKEGLVKPTPSHWLGVVNRLLLHSCTIQYNTIYAYTRVCVCVCVRTAYNTAAAAVAAESSSRVATRGRGLQTGGVWGEGVREAPRYFCPVLDGCSGGI